MILNNGTEGFRKREVRCETVAGLEKQRFSRTKKIVMRERADKIERLGVEADTRTYIEPGCWSRSYWK